MALFSSLEEKYGVDEPGYEPPDDSAEVEVPEDEWGSRISVWEALIAVVFPVGGLGLAIWRFSRNDVGPGLADLMLGIVGFTFACLLLLLLA